MICLLSTQPSKLHPDTFTQNRRSRAVRAVGLACLVAAILFGGASTGWAATPSKLVVFGDSLSDVGNAWIYTGHTSPPCPPYYQGRCSNGPLWIEDLASLIGVPIPTAYLATPSGTDYAIAGSTTSALDDEAAYYLAEMPGGAADPTALHVIWSGGNDFLNTLGSNPTATQLTACQNNLSTWVGNILSDVQLLHSAGATDFFVLNLPSLGDIPKYNGSANRTAINSVVDAFNDQLFSDLQSLEATHPDLEISTLDIYGLLGQVLADPEEYALTNVTSMAMTTPGADPDEYLFWDELHPTAAGHALVAQAARDLLVPEPGALVLLAGGVIMGLVVGARRFRPSRLPR